MTTTTTLDGCNVSDDLTFRVAQALGWSIADVRSFSLRALRELLRPVSVKLAHEIDIEQARVRAAHLRRA